MFVCVCNSIREKELRAAAKGCDGRASNVYAALGRRPKCGQCVAHARAIIDAERATFAAA